MIDLSPSSPFTSLRGIIFSGGKESSFKKVVQATMVRHRNHGPILELNRMLLKNKKLVTQLSNSYANASELASASSSLEMSSNMDSLAAKTVFAQAAVNVIDYTQEHSLFLPHRAWKVKFIGESVDDCGGGYSESIAEMCEELVEADRRQYLPLFIQTPNGRDELGSNQDCLILNPNPKLTVRK